MDGDSPPPLAPAIERTLAALNGWTFEGEDAWRMASYVERLEAWTGRPCDDQEIKDLAAYIARIEREASQLAAMLVGRGVVLPMVEADGFVWGEHVSFDQTNVEAVRRDYEESRLGRSA